MEGLSVAATQCDRPDVFRIQGLPPDGDLWVLRIIRAVERVHLREESGRQHSRGIGTVPFLAFCEVYFEAVKAREVPSRTGKWHSYFLVDSPDVSIDLVALTVG